MQNTLTEACTSDTDRHKRDTNRHDEHELTRTDTNRHEPTRTTRAIRRDTNQHEPTRTTRMTRTTRVDMCRVSAVYIDHCQRSGLARGQGHHIAQSPQDSPLLLGMENPKMHLSEHESEVRFDYEVRCAVVVVRSVFLCVLDSWLQALGCEAGCGADEK